MAEDRKDTGGVGRWGRGSALLAALALLILSACARVETKPPVEEEEPPAPPPGFVNLTLVPDEALKVKLSRATVTLDNVTATSGKGGKVSFPKVPPGKYYLVAEKRFPLGAIRRVLGVTIVYVADNPVELKVTMRDATDVDAYCSDCHPVKKRATRRDQVVRDVHPSGIVPKKATKAGGRLDEKGRVTCESCHTIHRATGHQHFALESFKDGKMCIQCH